MKQPWSTRCGGGRHRAAFFSCGVALAALLLVTGCGSRGTVLRNTLGAVLPGSADVSQHAAELPYASLDVSINGQGGLIVLARMSGAKTYFQAATMETIVLRHGYLAQTAGLDADLLMTRLRVMDSEQALGADNVQPPWQRAVAGQPLIYTVQRQWRTRDGVVHAASAQATLRCQQDPASVELPLATLSLQRCNETLVWGNGARTHSVLWREPDEHMLWRVSTVPWPGGPELAWSVARPWW